MSLLFERIISDNPDHYMTAMEQHRLEKRRMHRHSCVIAILCERIYSETAQIGKAENIQALGCVIAILQKGFNVEQHRLDKQRTHRHSMCHRNPLERI